MGIKLPDLPPDCDPGYNAGADWTDATAHPEEARRWRSRWARMKGRRSLEAKNLDLFDHEREPEPEPQGSLFQEE